jgi:hypothetical protein
MWPKTISTEIGADPTAGLRGSVEDSGDGRYTLRHLVSEKTTLIAVSTSIGSLLSL